MSTAIQAERAAPLALPHMVRWLRALPLPLHNFHGIGSLGLLSPTAEPEDARRDHLVLHAGVVTASHRRPRPGWHRAMHVSSAGFVREAPAVPDGLREP